jgi:hypothetical protein
VTGSQLRQLWVQNARTSAALSYFPARSGQLYYELHPYVLLSEEKTGADHGSPWPYDAHVPLLWLGAGILPGIRTEPVSIADVAPTLAALLGVSQPGGSQGRVLREMLR